MAFDPRALRAAADLFNRKFYFEAHDAFEDLWTAERSPDRGFLQALVHLSVGMVHVVNENHQGAVNLLSRGLKGLAAYGSNPHGLDLESLTEAATRCLRKSEDRLAGIVVEWEEPDRPAMHFND